jgi:hypothetical protein
MLPKNPFSMPVLFDSDPKATIRLLTPEGHAAPRAHGIWSAQNLISSLFRTDWEKIQKPPLSLAPKGIFMLYSDTELVRCRNGPVHVISYMQHHQTLRSL